MAKTIKEKNQMECNKKARAKYKEKLKRVPLDMQPDEYDKMKEHTQQINETVNGFIKRAIRETMENDIKKL